MVADFVSPRARWPQGTWHGGTGPSGCSSYAAWPDGFERPVPGIAIYSIYIYGWWFLSKKYARHLNQLYFFYVLFNNVQHHLVGGFTPLKNISQVGWLFPRYGKIKNVPNHQLDIYVSYQTTKLWSPSLGSHGCFEIYIYSKIGNLEWHCWKKKHIVW